MKRLYLRINGRHKGSLIYYDREVVVARESYILVEPLSREDANMTAAAYRALPELCNRGLLEHQPRLEPRHNV